MKSHRTVFIGILLTALELGAAVSAGALEWPSRHRSQTCQRCGKPLTGFSIPAPPPPDWPANTGYAYPGRCCPPSAVCPPGAAPAVPGAEGQGPATGVAPTTPEVPPNPPQPEAPPATPETAPPATATPPMLGAADTSTPAASSGLGGDLGGPTGALVMFGDIAPFARLAVINRPGGPFAPPTPPIPPPNPGSDVEPLPPDLNPDNPRNKSAILMPSVRGFKIADNQTPLPVNRIAYGFNYFNDLNEALNRRFGAPINGIQAYTHNFGLEKTFLDETASVGLRLPLNTISGDSPIPTIGKTSTSLGNLSVYFKYALWIDRPRGRALTTGLAVTAPTGPTAFGGASYLRSFNFTQLQPYLSFLWTQDRWYMMGYSSIEVPTDSRDVTMWYNDLSLGYYAYRNPRPEGFIKTVAPTFEVHVNTPLNHRDVFNINDFAGTADAVDLTTGLNMFLGGRSVLSLGVVAPVTGPRPFSVESMLLFNVFY